MTGASDPEPEPLKEKWQSHWVPAPHFYNLNQACMIINKALGESFGCYLVGSSLTRRDYRDIDVRFIMADDAYDRMFRNDAGYTNPLWSLMCTTISLWLRQQTDLPIDFQIQRMTQANRDHAPSDGHKRNALGIFHDYPGERPSEIKP